MLQSIKERFCAVIGKIAPKWCVKNKYNANQWYLWSLTPEMEQKMIRDLELSDKELSTRCWSLKTRTWLLEQKRYACVSAMSSVEEFTILLEEPQSVATPILIEALKSYTPNAKGLSLMIEKLEVFQLLSIAKKVPSVFNDMKLDDLFQDFKDLHRNIDKETSLVSVLSEVNSNRWMMPIINYLTSVHVNRLNDEAKEILKECIEKAYKKGENLASYVFYCYQNFPQQYRLLKTQRGKCVEYMQVMLPKLEELMCQNQNRDIDIHKMEYSELVRVIAGFCDGHEGAYNALVYRVNYIQCFCDAELFNNVKNVLIANVKTREHWKILYDFVTEEEVKDVIRKRCAFLKSSVDNAKFLLEFYPFAEWKDKETVKNLCGILIDNSLFPVERCDELNDDEVVKYVAEALITRSQNLYLKDCDASKWMTLFNETRLTPASECYMLTLSYMRSNEKIEYIKKYGLSLEAYKQLLTMKSDYGYDYLVEYAKSKGLSDMEYALMLQSQYVDRAPYLTKYIKEK